MHAGMCIYVCDITNWKNSNLLCALLIYSIRRQNGIIQGIWLISGGFLGDIALPNIKYDIEWREQKLNKSYLEELKKYREEILKEGLQVEEEGLTGK